MLKSISRGLRVQARCFSQSAYVLNKKSQAPFELEMKIEPIQRTGETIEVKRARLLYQSRKRGILESDLLLSRFAKTYLREMTLEELEEYDQLLDEPDWDIYYWATKNYDVTPLPDKWKNSAILKKLQELSQNKDREILRMPSL